MVVCFVFIFFGVQHFLGKPFFMHILHYFQWVSKHFSAFFNLSSMFDVFLACIYRMLCEYLRGVSKELLTVQNGLGTAF